MAAHSPMLQAVQQRQQRRAKSEPFAYGIHTADRYVVHFQQLAGESYCEQVASRGKTSFREMLQKASETLTYSNPEMVVKEATRNVDADLGFDLPKNTLMVFKHVLTTPKLDRDGDILRTEGAAVDPKMLLLWQHMHSMPIGKLLGVVEHTKDRLVLASAIVDINEYSHDAAVMIDNKMGRFSHGFRPIEYEPVYEDEDKEWIAGFDIKTFEIMEESIVSVPSNTDAEVLDTLIELADSGKFTSEIMKQVSKQLKSQQPVQVTGTACEEGECDETKTEEFHEAEDDAREGSGEEPGDGETSPPEKAEVDVEEAEEEQGSAQDTEVVEPGKAPTVPEKPAAAGSVRSTLQTVVQEYRELMEHCDVSQDTRTLCERSIELFETILSDPLVEDPPAETDVERAMEFAISRATSAQRQRLSAVLRAIDEVERRNQQTRDYQAITGQ